jgi:tetratricopeptide (TPR) repeat protein
MVIIFVLVIIVAAILGGTLQVLQATVPDFQQQGVLPFIIATGITAVIANIIIAVMQWFGKSPLDFLPEKTLSQKDPKRFRLSKSGDPKILSEQSALAKKLDDYEWMAVFAEAWVEIQPGEVRAYEDLGTALIRLNRLEQAIGVGKRLIALRKMNHSGYSTVGEASMLLGDTAEAVKNFEEAVKYVQPEFLSYVAHDLAEAYAAVGRIDDAIAAMITAHDSSIMESNKPYLKSRIEHLQRLQAQISLNGGYLTS